MRDVWVAGAAMTRVGRRSERLQDLMAEAAHGALRSAGVDAPDAIVVAAMNPEEFVGDGQLRLQRRGDDIAQAARARTTVFSCRHSEHFPEEI